jgi:hypothetical protein
MNSSLKRGTRFFAMISLLVKFIATGASTNMLNVTEISAPVMGG